MCERLTGKVALVTGAGHGIGRACAQRLGQEGARLAVADIRAAAAEETVRLLREDGIEAGAWTADVSDPPQVEAMVASVLGHYGAIDILHANAGVLIAGTVETQTIEEWDRTFSVNVRGIFLTARAVIPGMRAQGSGTIINTASISGMIGEPSLAAYNASKGAVINLTRQMAAEYARAGIRVNCICPGWIETGFNAPVLDKLTPEELRRMIDTWIPLGRQGTADDIAPSVAFLASDDARYITGHALVIDGGLTAL
jgi:meso-butanediol dehydrogenase/(S,S)-butanediol dehydrogenase/diacetyl reductase